MHLHSRIRTDGPRPSPLPNRIAIFLSSRIIRTAYISKNIIHEIVLRVLLVQPLMLQHIMSQLPLLRETVQHRINEILKELRLLLREPILRNHHIFQTPVLQPRNPLKTTLLAEIFLRLDSS